MFRIMNPKGELLKAEKITAVCELRLDFNGKKERHAEPANRGAEPTGLAVYCGREMGWTPVSQPIFGSPLQPFQPFETNDFFVGNLKPQVVREIQQKLLQEGCFDFSSLEYQKTEFLDDTVFDMGRSKPYVLDYVAMDSGALEKTESATDGHKWEEGLDEADDGEETEDDEE